MAPNSPTARLCASAPLRQSGSPFAAVGLRRAQGTTTAKSQRRRGRRGPCPTSRCRSPKKNVGNGSELPDSAPLRLSAPLRQSRSPFASARVRRARGTATAKSRRRRGAEARVLQAVAVPPKKNVGNGSELPDSAPLRLCDKAVRRSRRWGCGGRREQPLQSRRDAGDAEARVPTSRCRSPKRNVGNGSELPDSAPLRLSAPLRQSRSPFASARVRRARGTATAKSRRRRGAEARVLQAVAVPPKKNVGNGSELPDSAPLRLCDKAVRRSRRWGCGGRREQPLQSRRDAGDAEARVPTSRCRSPKKNVGNGSELPDSAPLRLCDKAVRSSPFAVRGAAVAAASGTATATKPLLFVVLTIEPQSVASPRD
jgi:hypothetical protein